MILKTMDEKSLRSVCNYTKVLNYGGLSETEKSLRSYLLFRALSQIVLNAITRKSRVPMDEKSLRLKAKALIAQGLRRETEVGRVVGTFYRSIWIHQVEI